MRRWGLYFVLEIDAPGSRRRARSDGSPTPRTVRRAMSDRRPQVPPREGTKRRCHYIDDEAERVLDPHALTHAPRRLVRARDGCRLALDTAAVGCARA